MTGAEGWLFLAGLALLMLGAICAHHIPGLNTLIDGNSPPFTDTTETDDSWLRELPATQEDQ